MRRPPPFLLEVDLRHSGILAELRPEINDEPPTHHKPPAQGWEWARYFLRDGIFLSYQRFYLQLCQKALASFRAAGAM